MSEETFQFANLNLKYKTRQARKDIPHLVVMFSGIRPDKGYEFDGKASESIHGHWLWIRDELEGEHTYYLSHKSDTTIQDAVLALIDSELKRLNLTRDNCTLVGFSKGGAAALAIGLRGNFRNILASVPQIALGSYVFDTRPKIFSNMISNGRRADAEKLDQIIPNLVASDNNIEKNIYIISAVGDREYSTQVKPFLQLFDKYSNFNSLITNSPLVTAHNEVTKYNLNNIVAIINLLSIDIAPSWGKVKNGRPVTANWDSVEQFALNSKQGKELVSEVQGIELNGDRLYPKGLLFNLGQPISGFNQVKKELVLSSGEDEKVFPLSETRDKWVNSRYFANTYIDYSYAGFASRKHMGLDLSELPIGTYEIRLRLIDGGQVHSTPFSVDSQKQLVASSGPHIYTLTANTTGSKLVKRSVLGAAAIGKQFTIDKSWVRECKFHVQGAFAVQGFPIARWTEVQYLLVLKSDEETYSYELSASTKNKFSFEFMDDQNSYRSSYYTTSKFSGLDLESLPYGDYEAFVTMVCRGQVFTERIGEIGNREILQFERITSNG